MATDWTAVGANTATGKLLASTVTLSGTRVWDTPGSSVLDGSWMNFASSVFSPALPSTDEIHITNAPGSSYTIRFERAVTDPILLLGSLGSALEFPGEQAVRLSGEAGFTVTQSNTVKGIGPNDPRPPTNMNDASGAIKLLGRHTSVTFRAPLSYAGPQDGIYVQLAVQPGCTNWTSVAANTATGNLRGATATLSGTRVWDTPGSSVLDGSWTCFASAVFSPALARTDELHITNAPGSSYTLVVAGAHDDLVLLLGSLGSPLEFTSTPLRRVSGEAGFTVPGTYTVNGVGPNDPGPPTYMNDASGSIRLLSGSTSIEFHAPPAYAGPQDGIYVQLCA